MATPPSSAGVSGINIAALNSIQDQNTRAVLQQLIDGWHVRNGVSGSGDNAFITKGELTAMKSTGTGLFGNGQLGQAAGNGTMGNINPDAIPGIISQMQARIMTSPLFIDLGTRIDLVDAATLANGTAITSEITNRTNADNAIYTTYNAQISVINGNVASLSSTVTTTVSNVAALSSSVTTLTAQVGTNTTAISTESSARVSADNSISSKYSVKIDTNGYVTGFGLISTANNSTPYSQFIVRSDQFAIASPSGPGITPQVPFIVNTTTDADGNGPGVYIDTAMIKILHASKIDTRGLTIKDAYGTVIFGSGTSLDWSLIGGIPGGIYNSAISIGSNGVLSGAGGGSVSLSGLGAGAMATINQINSGNVWTYIGAGAIGTAFITNAAITSALIGNAEVGTLKVAGNAIGFSGGMTGGGGVSFYCADAGMLSCVCYTGGTTDIYGGAFALVVDGGVPYTLIGVGFTDAGGGTSTCGPATGVWQGYLSAGWHSVGFYQSSQAYNSAELLWFFAMR